VRDRGLPPQERLTQQAANHTAPTRGFAPSPDLMQAENSGPTVSHISNYCVILAYCFRFAFAVFYTELKWSKCGLAELNLSRISVPKLPDAGKPRHHFLEQHVYDWFTFLHGQ
jgi:hypothetical protein